MQRTANILAKICAARAARLFVTFQAKRGLMDFMVNREINFTVTAREFTISLREIEISR